MVEVEEALLTGYWNWLQVIEPSDACLGEMNIPKVSITHNPYQ